MLVTGDAKVVDRGKGNGLYVNTAGIGVIEHAQIVATSSVRPGEVLLLSGDIGRHGMAVIAAREGWFARRSYWMSKADSGQYRPIIAW